MKLQSIFNKFTDPESDIHNYVGKAFSESVSESKSHDIRNILKVLSVASEDASLYATSLVIIGQS